MLRLFKRSSPLSAADADHSPLDRLLSLSLAYARAEGATALIIGMPRELPASIGTKHEAEFRKQLTEERDLNPPNPDSDVRRALASSSRLKSAAGWKCVPMWMRIDGQLYALTAPPIESHLAFLSLFQQRLVSLDASEAFPKPTRYIEYDSENPNERWFAEVELLWDEDNTLRIEILRHLRVPLSVRTTPFVT